MNIYEKLQKVRNEMVGIKKSGKNKFANYEYYELEDFLPLAMRLFLDNGLCSVVSYGLDRSAKLTLVNTEKTDEQIVIESSSANCDLKGCHDVQNMGAVQTYQRRYLYVTLLEITEKEIVDSQEPDTDGKKKVEPDGKKPAPTEDTLWVTKQQFQDLMLLDNSNDLSNGVNTLKEQGAVFNKAQWAALTTKKKNLIAGGN